MRFGKFMIDLDFPPDRPTYPPGRTGAQAALQDTRLTVREENRPPVIATTPPEYFVSPARGQIAALDGCKCPTV
jgi:hypothetical protein